MAFSLTTFIALQSPLIRLIGILPKHRMDQPSSNAPTSASGQPASPGAAPGSKKPDAYAFFRNHYASSPDVPKGRTDLEVDAFEKEYGKDIGYTRAELSDIAKAMRKSVREERAAAKPDSHDASPQDSRRWEQWIRGIGFGSFLLAALGVIFYATVVRKIGL